MQRMHCYISGRVQGVFFRAHTLETARSLELAGWVRNLRDGRVEAVFEGDEQRLESMLEWCRRGSPMSHVEGVEVVREDATGEFDGFVLR